jgi:hypothetical protein
LVIFALLDPDPYSESGFRSTGLIESGSNPDPEPKHRFFPAATKFAVAGLSATKGIFTKEILQTMNEQIDHPPIIFPLSNPTSR